MKKFRTPLWLRRLFYKARRGFYSLSPYNLLMSWEYDGWGEEGWHETWKTSVADWLLWKYNICIAIVLCLLGMRGDELAYCRWWERALYRAKAILCLIAGRHWHGESFRFDGVQVAWWDGEMSGYYEPEWDDSHVSVGTGWKNWRVELDLRMR